MIELVFFKAWASCYIAYLPPCVCKIVQGPKYLSVCSFVYINITSLSSHINNSVIVMLIDDTCVAG